MKQVLTIAFAVFLTGAGGIAGFAQATDGTGSGPTPGANTEQMPENGTENGAEDGPATGPLGMPIYDAAEISLDDFLWTHRLLVVLADSRADPAFDRQIRFILEREQAMIDRDVVLITDSDPAARSQARTRLRPRGFMLAIIDKDGEIKQRRPSARDGREIIQTIDKFPSRREEFLEQNPSGRE